MSAEGLAYADILKDAQKLGYAEANPAADVEGKDAARKIVILASLAYGKAVDPDTISAEGITEITLDDIATAESFGCAIKLIGHYEKAEDGRLSLSVAPRFVPFSTPLAGIDDVFNGIMVRGSMLGDSLFYGKGAGKLPTASAVCADIIDAAKNPEAGAVPLCWTASDDNLSAEEIKTRLCIIAKADSDAATAAKKAAIQAVIQNGICAVITDADASEIKKADGFIRSYAVM